MVLLSPKMLNYLMTVKSSFESSPDQILLKNDFEFIFYELFVIPKRLDMKYYDR